MASPSIGMIAAAALKAFGMAAIPSCIAALHFLWRS